MKKMQRILATLVLVALLFNLAGCYGSFSLTKKVYDWNGSLGNKWMNTVVMWILMWLPVYEAAGFIDFAILNSVEFWTGTNPLAMEDGQQQVKYATNDGKTYKIEMQKNQISITETVGPDKGKAISLTFNAENGNWTMDDGKTASIFAKATQGNMTLFNPNGDPKNVKLVY